MTQLFISDLHLDKSRPAATEAFKHLLATEGRDAERVYILGDLFEVWVGDDDPGDLANEVAEALQDLHRHGTSCYFINGNRDFLLNRSFATKAGMHLLPDVALVDLYGTKAVLMHGDLLCTDDKSYQRFRKVVHNWLVQCLFLALPLSVRRKIAGAARDKSTSVNAGKDEYIMDVNQDAVERLLTTYNVDTVIHGHTHRPASHRFDINGNEAHRIVLGDWYEQGSILRWDESGPALESLPYNNA